jgi:hypothetical protein
MTVMSRPQKPGRRPVDKCTEVRKFRQRPQAICPHCGTPAIAYSSPPGVRYIRCPLCAWRSKEAR